MRDVGRWLQDDTFGGRARIGTIIPSAAVTFEHEWARMLPRGVSFHVTRLWLAQGSAAGLTAMAGQAAEAARVLTTSRVHLMAYACTLGSLFRGVAGERALCSELEQAAGVPAVTMARAATEALGALGIRRVAVANPYGEEANGWVRQYLEGSGLEVLTIRSRPVTDSWSIAELPPEVAFELGAAALEEARDAEGLFLSCGNLRTIEVLDALERASGRPVISSNQAMLWYALTVLGIDTPVRGYGRLLELPRGRPASGNAGEGLRRRTIGAGG